MSPKKQKAAPPPDRHLVLLIGRPGSGKADYCKTLDGYQVIPAREGASLAASKRELAAAIAANVPRLVINRTNARRRDRAAFLEPARVAGYKTTIVWLNVPRDTCERVAARRSNGALPTAAIARAMAAFEESFDYPMPSEADERYIVGPDPHAKPGQAAATPDPAAGPAATIADKVLLLLVSGAGEASIAEGLAKLGVPAEERPAILAEARRRITLAADYHRDHELGQAIVRLNDCYRRSLAVQDAKPALASQKELNKLMDLYAKSDAPPPVEGESQAAAELAAIGHHLIPLGLAPADSPLEEHARLAALRILAS